MHILGKNQPTKVAVITGSTSGIGLGVAERFAKYGLHVVINGYPAPANLSSIESSLKSLGAASVLHHGADLSKADEIKSMFEKIKSKYDRVDILVNNAGIQFVSPVDTFPEDKWEQIVRVNLISNFYTIKYSLPYMKKNGWGRIVNIASAHGLIASPFKSAYVTAKHGVLGKTFSFGSILYFRNIQTFNFPPRLD